MKRVLFYFPASTKNAVIGGLCAFGASAGSYKEMDMTKSWTETRLDGDLECKYWPWGFLKDCSAQTRLAVTPSNQSGASAYVYLRGQGQSVGNEKSQNQASGGWITTDRCYAKGIYA
ncbi:MAG TPA: hypothetical protein H9684_08280 [Firmicutes bacterium]|nr:hypothetical protein [Bacillota bacterium]